MTQAQEQAALEHYTDLHEWYQGWNQDHIHFGLFEPGNFPTDSAGFLQALERMIEIPIAPAGIEAHHHVVDAGCGVGGTAIYLAQTRGCRVTGVNLNRMQLEVAGQKVVEQGVADRVRFEYANCSEHLPFADDSIDIVTNIESAYQYRDRGQFLREVHRILKPGGRIAATDGIIPDDSTADQYETYIRPMLEPWALASLESRSSYKDLLRAAGLHVVEFEGFNGWDSGNLEILHRYRRFVKGLYVFGESSPAFVNRLDAVKRMESLCAAWQSGYFRIERYCAAKPHKPDRDRAVESPVLTRRAGIDDQGIRHPRVPRTEREEEILKR